VPRTVSRRRTARNVLEELSGVSERPMIIPMTTTGRLQQRYDHRLRDLVQGTGDVTIATDLGVPRSTARGWLGKAPKVVVSLDVTNLKASELQQEVLELRRRVKKLTALLRLALALLRSSGFTLTHELITKGVLRRVLAFTELKFSNSMIEAWWRSLKHQWLFLHSSDSVTTVRRLVEFCVQEQPGASTFGLSRTDT